MDKKLIEDTGVESNLENLDIKKITGRFKLHYEDILWECLWIPSAKNRLVVSLSAGGKRLQDLPRFNRWTFQDVFDCCFLGIEDPMYGKFHVTTGWFFGDNNHDYCDYVADIVEHVKSKLNIEEVLFYASSAGGTAAIRVASKLHYGTVVAICPQLDISLHHPPSVKAIERIIGVSVEADPMRRNNVIENMIDKTNRDVNFILIENLLAGADAKQAKYAAKIFNKRVEYGVNYLSDNVFMWAYEADDGLNAHTSQDWRAMLPSILSICNEYIREGRVSKAAVNCMNELWYDHFKSQKTVNQWLKKGDFSLVGTNVCMGRGFQFVDSLSDIIVEGKNSDYNYYKYSLEKNMFYYCEILCEAEETSNFSIVVYDFEHVVRLYHYEGTIGKREKVNFLTGNNCNDYTLLIYAGIHGATRNKQIKIKELVVSSGAISNMQCSFVKQGETSQRKNNIDAEIERQI